MPSWLEEMREERVVRYDTLRYPLAEAAAAVLELRPGETLDTLHLREAPTDDTPVPSCPTLVHAFAHAGHKLPRAWKQAKSSAKAVQKLHRTPAYQAFLRLYDLFVKEVLLPSCAGHDMVYQRPPTLRVAMPARTATIGLHCDSDYDGHSSAECNFWVPLTRVAGSNSLHVESAPGLGDFRPLELSYGECFRFNGNRCRHYTEPNASGATRVSFDLRMLPESLWEELPEALRPQHAQVPGQRDEAKEVRRRKIGDYGTAVARAAAVREVSVSQLLTTHTHLVK